MIAVVSHIVDVDLNLDVTVQRGHHNLSRGARVIRTMVGLLSNASVPANAGTSSYPAASTVRAAKASSINRIVDCRKSIGGSCAENEHC